MHLGRQTHGLLVYLLSSAAEMWHKLFARIVFIDFHGKGCQWNKVDTVSVFERSEVGISQT